MLIIHFILDEIRKLLTYYMPFCHQSLQSCDLKWKCAIFWATLYNMSFNFLDQSFAQRFAEF